MLKKYCFICGCYFETNNARAKYCSIECKKEGRRRYLEKWKKENPDYMKEWAAAHPDYTKEWTEKHPGYYTEKTRARRARLAAEK